MNKSAKTYKMELMEVKVETIEQYWKQIVKEFEFVITIIINLYTNSNFKHIIPNIYLDKQRITNLIAGGELVFDRIHNRM